MIRDLHQQINNITLKDIAKHRDGYGPIVAEEAIKLAEGSKDEPTDTTKGYTA